MSDVFFISSRIQLGDDKTVSVISEMKESPFLKFKTGKEVYCEKKKNNFTYAGYFACADNWGFAGAGRYA